MCMCVGRGRGVTIGPYWGCDPVENHLVDEASTSVHKVVFLSRNMKVSCQ